MLVQSKRADPGRSTLSNAALAGGSNHPTDMEMTMTSHNTSAPVGATTTISPTLGKVYRSGAATTDQLLVELCDQFKLDAKAIDPTITGLWLYRDLTAPNRDPRGAVSGFFIEREHAPLRSSDRKAGAL